MPHFLRRILPGVALAVAAGLAGCKDNPTAPTRPSAPTALQVASNSPSQVTLKWKSVVDASGYVVQRSIGTAGAFVAIGAINDTTYIDATV